MEFASTVEKSNLECGFASTDATFAIPGRNKMYWHKGKGIISCIILNEAKEVEYADIITGILLANKRLHIR